jgi:hypothetical protein
MSAGAIVTVIVVVAVLMVVGIYAAAYEAKKAYLASLEELKKDPTSVNLPQRTLELGRKLAGNWLHSSSSAPDRRRLIPVGGSSSRRSFFRMPVSGSCSAASGSLPR